MSKPVLAVLFGGCSSEYTVSLHSAGAVLGNLDHNSYAVVPIGITRDGTWYRYTGPYAHIEADTWASDPKHLTPVAVSQDRSVRGLIEFTPKGPRSLPLDLAFPVLHGKNGEDGTVQGLFELAGIPLVGCGSLASALCMDKDRAHKLASLAGVDVPRSCVLDLQTDRKAAEDLAARTGYPLFVKPVKAGSSHGITRVTSPEGLEDAIDLAFQYDGQVIVEEAISGFEVGCAVMGTNVLTVGELDEIELADGFFDYYEKYNLDTSSIHVPARIDEETSMRLKDTAKTIYRALGCSGFARVDMFLTPEGRIVFNEVNTIPGFTEHSRYPGMMAAIGLPFPALLSALLRQAQAQ